MDSSEAAPGLRCSAKMLLAQGFCSHVPSTVTGKIYLSAMCMHIYIFPIRKKWPFLLPVSEKREHKQWFCETISPNIAFTVFSLVSTWLTACVRHRPLLFLWSCKSTNTDLCCKKKKHWDILALSVPPTDFENGVLLSHFRQSTLKHKQHSYRATATSMVSGKLKRPWRSFNNIRHTDLPSPPRKQKVNQIPGAFFWHILYRATSEKTERVMTIKVMTTGKIMPAKEGEHNFICCPWLCVLELACAYSSTLPNITSSSEVR